MWREVMDLWHWDVEGPGRLCLSLIISFVPSSLDILSTFPFSFLSLQEEKEEEERKLGERRERGRRKETWKAGSSSVWGSVLSLFTSLCCCCYPALLLALHPQHKNLKPNIKILPGSEVTNTWGSAPHPPGHSGAERGRRMQERPRAAPWGPAHRLGWCHCWSSSGTNLIPPPLIYGPSTSGFLFLYFNSTL